MDFLRNIIVKAIDKQLYFAVARHGSDTIGTAHQRCQKQNSCTSPDFQTLFSDLRRPAIC